MVGQSYAACCVGNVENRADECAFCCVMDAEASVPARSTDKIFDELNGARTRAQERAKVPDRELADYAKTGAAELKDLLNSFIAEEYAGRKLTFDVKNLDALTKNFVDNLNGFVGARVCKRLVPEDKEVVVILSEPDAAKRKKNFDAFNERLFQNALKDLLTAIKEFYRALADSFKRDVSAFEKMLTDAGKSADKLDDVRAQFHTALAAKRDYICNALKAQLDASKEKFPAESLRLRDIAAEFDFTIVGDGNLEISALKYAHEADEHSLAIVFNDKDVINTAAQAVLTEPRVLPVAKSFLYSGFNGLNAAIVKVARLLIAEGIYPDYDKLPAQTLKDGSMFGKNVAVGEGTVIAPLVSVGENVTIGKNCSVAAGVFIGSGTVIGDGVKILAGSRVGVNCHYHFERDGRHESFCGVGRTIIEDNAEIGANTVIQRGAFSDTVIGARTIIGNLVEIAHDVKIGADCLIVSQVGLCGNVTIGERVKIFGQAGVKDWVTVGDGAIILAKSGVTKNIRAGQKVSGMFSREHRTELKRLAKSKIVGEE